MKLRNIRVYSRNSRQKQFAVEVGVGFAVDVWFLVLPLAKYQELSTKYSSV
jgi:hypothetical protein